MTHLDTTAAIETPERIRFRYRISGPGRRFVAWSIDFAIRIVLLIGLAIAVGLFASITWSVTGESALGLLLLGIFALEWLYGAVFEWLWSGRTPGKFVLGLRVVRVDGSPGRFPDFLLRNLLKAVDFLPAIPVPSTPFWLPTFGISLITMMVDPRLRRIGDMVAGTVVVIEQRARVLEAVTLKTPVSEAEREGLPGTVRLSRQEKQILEEFLRRKRRLSKGRAEELAQLFAPTLSAREGVEADSFTRVLELAYARAVRKDR